MREEPMEKTVVVLSFGFFSIFVYALWSASMQYKHFKDSWTTFLPSHLHNDVLVFFERDQHYKDKSLGFLRKMA